MKAASAAIMLAKFHLVNAIADVKK